MKGAENASNTPQVRRRSSGRRGGLILYLPASDFDMTHL